MTRMNTASMFRRASVERVSSPEQIDRVLPVTQPRAWLAMTGCAFLVFVAAFWSVVGTIPVEIAGQGILVRSGGLYEVVVVTSGRLVDVSVAVGDSVRQGQVVARVAQPDLVDKLTQARTTIRNQEASHERLKADSTRAIDLQLRLFDQQAHHVNQAMAAARENLQWFEDKIATQRELVQEGRLTKQALITTVQQHDDVKERLRRMSDELADIAVKRLQAQTEHTRRVQESNAELTAARVEQETLERRVSAAGDVTSPYTGRVIELMVEQGDVVTSGEALFTLDLTGRTVTDLQAILYVSSQQGKRLRPGMGVQIAPTIVAPEEFGQLLGRVTYVSDFPTTPRGMQRVLKNEQLVEALSGSSPPHEVHADLSPDVATVSGYRWSSSKGPPIKLQSGTMCTAEIIVEQRRPIELLVPFFRRAGGL
jgi:HlyD family secretion protein